MTGPKMMCSGCRYITADSRAVTCCSGHCLDASGQSCDSWPCPNCGRHHYWTGSVPAALAKARAASEPHPTQPTEQDDEQ